MHVLNQWSLKQKGSEVSSQACFEPVEFETERKSGIVRNLKISLLCFVRGTQPNSISMSFLHLWLFMHTSCLF